MKFLWGAATSSHQIEGGNVHNDWWQWEAQGKIETGEISGAATDHWNRFQEDLRWAADLGMNSYRFSVEWSRWEPEAGHWDEGAIDWYRALVAECEKRGLLPMLTLYHFTLPRWLAERGGFAAPDAPDRFALFVEKVASVLGPRVPLWCTLNEPMALVVGAYLGSFMPPSIVDPKLASLATANLFRAHVKAYDILHSRITERKGPWKDHPIQVGIAHNMIDFRPLREWHLGERLTTEIFRRYYNRSWPDALTGRRQHFGVRGLIPYVPQVKEALGRRTVDYLGINYYLKVYVRMQPYFDTPVTPQVNASVPNSSKLPIGIAFSKVGDTVSDLGWAVHPQGLGRMIRFMSRYGLPLYITENGIADDKDRLRPGYLVSHLKEIASAVAAGSDVRGYFHWSLLDNFEWVKGFAPRFGLLEVDYRTFERKPRLSAELYRRIIAEHRELADTRPQAQAIERAYSTFK